MHRLPLLLFVAASFFCAAISAVRAQTASSTLLAQFEAGIRETAQHIESRFNDETASQNGEVCQARTLGCSFGSPPGLLCDARFGTDSSCNCSAKYITFDREVTIFAPGVEDADHNEINCRTQRLAESFSPIARKYDMLSLYSGFQTGIHKSWPGRNWAQEVDAAGCHQPSPKCSDFDPRFRNWYISAATGPKNVVLVLDTSGSMIAKRRISLMKEAAISIVRGLSFADFIGIVTFGDKAHVAGNLETLVRATSDHRNLLTVEIDNLYASGGTNMEAGFASAFDLLQQSLRMGQSSQCHNALLFLTDGKVSVGKEGGALAGLVAERNVGDIDARIFTYAFGSDAETDTLKDIACQNKGLFTAIPDSDSGVNQLRTAMGQYFEYFATAVDSAGPVWAEPFLECCGMGIITSVSHAVYNRSGSVPTLLGAVGSSLPLSKLGNATLEELLDRSKRCYTVDLTEAELEELRGDERCHYYWWEWLLIAVFGIWVPVSCVCSCAWLVALGDWIDNNFSKVALVILGAAIPVFGWIALGIYYSRNSKLSEDEKSQVPPLDVPQNESSLEMQVNVKKNIRHSSNKPSKSPKSASNRRPQVDTEESSASSLSSSSSEVTEAVRSQTTTPDLSSAPNSDISSTDDALCIVCERVPPGLLLAPCGHSGVCAGCAKVATKCPVCSKPVTGVLMPF